VRVALLGYDIVAVSNTPTAEQIHSMIDRYRTAALPFAGSSLLSRYYSKVPLLSVAWGIGEIGLPLKNGGGRVMGLKLPLPVDATFIASLSWIGKIHLRVEEMAPSEASAADTTESLQTILVLLRSMENSSTGQPFDADMRTFINSVNVDRHDNEAMLTATVPTGMVERFLNSPRDFREVEAPNSGGAGGAKAGGDSGKKKP
jgi:hypothetical protein